MPPPRYTYHHATTGSWYVYDRLLNRRVPIDTSALSAADIARDYEATWRRACVRWQQEEHQIGLVLRNTTPGAKYGRKIAL